MSDKNKNQTDKPKKDSLRHDGLVKGVMENPAAAAEFMDEYLPPAVKEKLDLSTVKLEKESYVEPDLKKMLSDVVCSVKLKDNRNAFVYTLVEHQSSSDYWIALRLWKYTLLLLERHKKGRSKLPVVIPIIIYNGNRKYTAPRNLWALFDDPEMAKEAMAGDYGLIDLHAMNDDDLPTDKSIGFWLHVMKHIWERDTLEMLDSAMKHHKVSIKRDEENNFIITKSILWYTTPKLDEEQQQRLGQIVKSNLSEEDGEYLMGSLAQKFIDEGVTKGISIGKQEGISIGESRGEARGEARGISIGELKGVQKTAIKMLKMKTDVKFISSVTGLTITQITKLKNSL